jgi:hypothetical protein
MANLIRELPRQINYLRDVRKSLRVMGVSREWPKLMAKLNSAELVVQDTLDCSRRQIHIGYDD